MTLTITRLYITNTSPLNLFKGMRINVNIRTRSDLLFHNLIPPFQLVHGYIPTPQDPLNHMFRLYNNHPCSGSTMILHIGVKVVQYVEHHSFIISFFFPNFKSFDETSFATLECCLIKWMREMWRCSNKGFF